MVNKIDTDNKIFSGTHSKDMWSKINNAKTVKDLAEALFIVCCRIQELENKIDNIKDGK